MSFLCCVQYVFTRWNSKQTYYKLPRRYRKYYIENNPRCTNCKYASKPLVPTLRFPAGSLRALLTGTWACSKMDLFIDGGHRNNDSNKRQHPNNALILCGTNDQRGISYSDSTTFWNGHVTCFIKKGLFHPHYFHPHYVFLASKQYGLTRRWSTPEKRLCLTYKSPSGWCRNVLPSRWM